MWGDELRAEIVEMFERLEVPTFKGFRTFSPDGYESPEARRVRHRRLEATPERKAYKAAWRAANRAKERARQKRWLAANPEARREKRRRYRETVKARRTG